MKRIFALFFQNIVVKIIQVVERRGKVRYSSPVAQNSKAGIKSGWIKVIYTMTK